MIRIREATSEDTQALAEILCQTGYPCKGEALGSRLSKYLGDPVSAVLVADDGAKVLGFACAHVIPLFHEDASLCRLTIMGVAETCRRRGVGRLLMNAIEEFARQNSCRRVEITSSDHRVAAHSFYRALGYKEVSRRFVRPFEGPTSGIVSEKHRTGELRLTP
jgi:GNAT superfamily N-acetyltransferase